MKTVRDILNVKGTDVWCVDPDATVFDALQRMAEKEVGALVVTEGAQVVGLISDVITLGKLFSMAVPRRPRW